MNQSSFGFTNVLNGISKTLNLANQVIPLYKEVSPMVKNAKNVISTISSSNLFNKRAIKKTVQTNQKKELSLNNPVFFQ